MRPHELQLGVGLLQRPDMLIGRPTGAAGRQHIEEVGGRELGPDAHCLPGPVLDIAGPHRAMVATHDRIFNCHNHSRGSNADRELYRYVSVHRHVPAGHAGRAASRSGCFTRLSLHMGKDTAGGRSIRPASAAVSY